MCLNKMVDLDNLRLNETEQNIINYIESNVDDVLNMSIRKLADACYVSSSTLFRFVKKLGFDGYNDFIKQLQNEEHPRNTKVNDIQMSEVMMRNNYSESYLKNIMETLRVVDDAKAATFTKLLNNAQKIFLFAYGPTKIVALYVHQLLTMMDYDVEMIHDEYEEDIMISRVSSDDLILVFSLSGENKKSVHVLQQIYKTPIVSFTQADNNTISGLSDLNFYCFYDKIMKQDLNISSRISMLALVELLIYQALQAKTV